jgi:recombination protein RecA
MGKKKASTADAAVDKKDKPKFDSNNVDAFLLKQFGDVFTNGNFLKNKVRQLIPVSPALDYTLGGGIHEGSFCVVTGPPKVGKTTMCLDFAGTAQKYECDLTPGEVRHVYFFSVEGRLKPRDIAGISSLNLDHFTAIESKPGNILNAEKFIEIAETLINTKPGCIFVLDSFSALCTAGEMTAEIGDRYRADSPLLLARFCRRISNILPINKCILLGVTHRIANQGGGGPGKSEFTEASGQKVQYGLDIKLKALYAEPYLDGEVQVGQKVHWVCTSTSTNQAPNRKCESLLRYGYGLDKEWELIQLCKDLGLVQVAGSWLTLPDGSKFQGAEKACQALKDNPAIFDSVHEQYRSLLGFEK